MTSKRPMTILFASAFSLAALSLGVISIDAKQSARASAALPTVWQGLDRDGDQQVTREEMRISAQERFRRADVNGDGEITLEEWIESAAFKARPESLARSFEIMDRDRSGAIEQHEIKQPPQNAGLFERMDRDGNGALTGEELVKSGY